MKSGIFAALILVFAFSMVPISSFGKEVSGLTIHMEYTNLELKLPSGNIIAPLAVLDLIGTGKKNIVITPSGQYNCNITIDYVIGTLNIFDPQSDSDLEKPLTFNMEIWSGIMSAHAADLNFANIDVMSTAKKLVLTPVTIPTIPRTELYNTIIKIQDGTLQFMKYKTDSKPAPGKKGASFITLGEIRSKQ